MPAMILNGCAQRARHSLPRHSETRSLPWTPEQMFDLVADVRRYPEFLPWVSAIRVKSEDEKEMVADMIVGFSALRETFRSRVVKKRPQSIVIDYIDGPLKFLHNEWGFRKNPKGGCLVDFSVDFEFRSLMFQTMAGTMFDMALHQMIGAFEMRAKKLYGSGVSGSKSSKA